MLNYFVILFFLFTTVAFSQTPQMSTVIQDSAINAFLQAIGPVSGTGQYQSNPYTWDVTNPRLVLQPGKGVFVADVQLKSGIFNYGTQAKGDVDIQYSPSRNQIIVRVTKATFEVAVTLFGNKIHISDVDITKYYKQDFLFPGPQMPTSKVQISLPNGKKKTLLISLTNTKMSILESQVLLTSDLMFK